MINCWLAMSRKVKEDHYRFYTVTDHRTQEKGFTEYRVCARFVSKRNPEDVKEVVVWRRFSDLMKLHGELSYTHRNLFRRLEEFPDFPRAQVFGRFEPSVIEERRKAAEAMLRFTVNIPALYNSPQLKDFFRGGEVRRPLDLPPVSESSASLPPPLIPLPRSSGEGGEVEQAEPQTEGEVPGSPSGNCEEATEACTEPEDIPSPAATVRCHGGSTPPPEVGVDHLESQEEFDLLFDSEGAGQVAAEAPPPLCRLSESELALFDPCAKRQATGPEASANGLEGGVAESASSLLLPEGSGGGARTPRAGPELPGYLKRAAEEIGAALEREAARDYCSAFQHYQTGVAVLLEGAQGDPDADRREAVRKRTVQYLQHAESIFTLQRRGEPDRD
ncbi:sorting nexin-15 [Polyodon spathula]|uniref:sorting nexin-15 n=1 Tax=Polyodon spathula TaxID=7913 RepID=UPI001B7E686B|nr:sorting nexin-15 [Polyodon spathula]